MRMTMLALVAIYAASMPASAQRVPISAPDSVPSAIGDALVAPANLLINSPGLRGTVIRDVLLVVFKHSATQRQRQAAIDLVHGTVVGGLPIGGEETFYVVRIPYVLARRDSTSGPLLRAMAALGRLPAVDGAVQMLLDVDEDYDRRRMSEVPRQPDRR